MVTQEPGNAQNIFFTPKRFAQEQAQRMESGRGRLLIASCSSGDYLAARVAKRYEELLEEVECTGDILHLESIDFRFSDSETCVRLDIPVNGDDVYLFQALFDPISEHTVDQNCMAFLIASRTFREAGASHVTAVLPYLAYARQDKPSKFMREPTTARLMADLAIAAGVDRLVAWHPHVGQLRGFYAGIPVDLLDPLTLFMEAFQRFKDREDVIAVAPDAGASKLVTYFGRALNLKCAIASKYRPEPEQAIITEMIGDFAGKSVAIVLDDMIGSGSTVYALVRRLAEKKGIQEIYLGVSHNLCMESAFERLLALYTEYRLQEVVVTNSIPQTEKFRALPFVSVRCLSDTLSRTINRIHYNRSISELFSHC
jgi:ribose-phosphate pyrophosphokinase